MSRGRFDLAIGREQDADVHERRGRYSMAIVCRRSSVSTSFMLAALRVLHVDISVALGAGSLDRARPSAPLPSLAVGSVVLSANRGELVP